MQGDMMLFVFWHVVLSKTVQHMDNEEYLYEWVWDNEAIRPPDCSYHPTFRLLSKSVCFCSQKPK